MTSKELDDQAQLLAEFVRGGGNCRAWLRPFHKRTKKSILKRALVILEPENKRLGYPSR
jgi:hypothetical protein